MIRGGKLGYLKKLTSRLQFPSVDVGEKIEGTSPPSVFIGSMGYPKVFAGPMIAQEQGDTSLLDAPERWIPNGKTVQDIVHFRLKLVRGKRKLAVEEVQAPFVQKLQEIVLAKNSVDTHAEFTRKPTGFQFHEDHQPFGPSAPLRTIETSNVPWEPHLEKVYYDTDLKAEGSAIQLYQQELPFTQIQKAFSVGTMGLKENRKLVPTRWSITAVDDILGKHLVGLAKQNPAIEAYQVYEFKSLQNYFAVLLMPTTWQYEWMEAFIHVMGKEELLFGDYENFEGKKEYSSVGGCYYAVRFAVAERLVQLKKQAGAVVFREAYPGYVPLGVFNCRENARIALKQQPEEFESLQGALAYISTKVWLPMTRFLKQSVLLKERKKQMQLTSYV